MHLPHTGGRRHRLTAPPRVIPIDIQEVASRIPLLPQEQQRRLVRQLVQFPEKTMGEIAKDLCVKKDTVHSLFSRTCGNLGMPGRQYNVEEKRNIIQRAWQLAYPAE